MLACVWQVLFALMRARYKFKIYAPATSGHPDFDRAFRVQQNFVEHYVCESVPSPQCIPALTLLLLGSHC